MLQKEIDKLLKKLNIPLWKYPTWQTFVLVEELRRDINFKKVEKQLRKLTGEKQGSLYDKLIKLFKDKNFSKQINRRKYRELRKYLRYIELSKEINSQELLKEEKQILGKISDSLCKTEEERSLIFISDYFQLLAKFLLNQITSEELDKFYKKAEKLSGKYEVISKKYPNELKDLIDKAISLEPYLNLMGQFYRTANERNEIFVKKVSNFMSKNKRARIVLTIGGFHTKGVARLLNAKNIPYVVVMPRVTTGEFSRKRYFALLKGELPSGYREFLVQKLELPSFLQEEKRWLSRRIIAYVTSFLIAEYKKAKVSDDKIIERVNRFFAEWYKAYKKERGKEAAPFDFELEEAFKVNNVLYFPFRFNNYKIAVVSDKNGQKVIFEDELKKMLAAYKETNLEESMAARPVEVREFSDETLKLYSKIYDERVMPNLEVLLTQLKKQKKRLIFINATSFGGGVAEILHQLVPMIRKQGVDADWYILEALKKYDYYIPEGSEEERPVIFVDGEYRDADTGEVIARTEEQIKKKIKNKFYDVTKKYII